MELLQAIYQRRATRQFSDTEVRSGLVIDLIRAATQAPSALNQQPWAFAVLHGRARLAKYSERAKAHLLATSDPLIGMDSRIDQYARVDVNIFHGADTLVVIYAKPGRFAPADDCLLAAQNLMLAALELGLGSCPVGFARRWFNLPEVKIELGILPNYTPVMPIVLGYAAHPPPAPVPRHAPETVCWQWDE